MNFSSILNELAGATGQGQSQTQQQPSGSSLGNKVQGIASGLPGGFAGGAVAGGAMALLLGNKSVRKTAGKAAKYGGAAILGGLAYKAYKGWQENNAQPSSPNTAGTATPASTVSTSSIHNQASPSFEQEAMDHMNGVEPPRDFQLIIIKAMIAAARADGQIDPSEQQKISDAIERLDVDAAAKSDLLQLFLKPLSIEDVTTGLTTLEQKAEVYLASCLAIDLDHQAEYIYLGNLSQALQLPPGLEQELRNQATNPAV